MDLLYILFRYELLGLDHVPSEMQLKVNCRPKVNFRIKFGLSRPTDGRQAQIFSYNSLSAEIRLYIILPYLVIFGVWVVVDVLLGCVHLLGNIIIRKVQKSENRPLIDPIA